MLEVSRNETVFRSLMWEFYFVAVCVFPEALKNDSNEWISEELLMASAKSTEHSVKNKVCTTSACLETAKNVMKWMDDSVDPCDNFYEFACGKFINTTEIPDEKSSVDSFVRVQDLVEKQLREIINEDEQPDEPRAFSLVKRLNKACLNRDIIEERGNQPLLDLMEHFGGWPVVKGDSWTEDSFDWTETIKKMRTHGLNTNIVISFTVTTDLQNSLARVCDVNIKLILSYYDF